MIELCLDTSITASVALVRDGEVVARARDDSSRHHAESVTPLVREVLGQAGITGPLAAAGIDRVLVGTGPAPYTGLRAGLVSARVLARGAGARVWGASSLDITARQSLDLVSPEARVVVVSDARRKELYWALYRAEGPDDVVAVSGPQVGAPQRLANELRDLDALLVSSTPLPPHALAVLSQAAMGPTAALDPACLSRIVGSRLARGEEGRLGTEPLYLRRPDIQGQPTRAL